MWVFRDGKEPVRSRELVRELQNLLSRISISPRNTEDKLDALIRTGELESALADQLSPATPVLAQVTDALASALLVSDHLVENVIPRETIEALELPETLLISPPEGFAYYALHPMDFAEAASRLAEPGQCYAVIGIRNIGTTLAAVAAAALTRNGNPAERITIRPIGHPYDRTVQFSDEQIGWIRAQLGRSASFLVVDEGPGLSGSSFLGTGEALSAFGVPAKKITFLGTREPDVHLLRARDAATRWPRFRWQRAAPLCSRRFSEGTFLGGGAWRDLLLDGHSEWPPSWTQMERLKFLSPDRQWLFKFEGLGRFGKKIQERALCLSAAGFGCDAFEESDGFFRYPFSTARPAAARDLSRRILDRIAAYCAFRACELKVKNAPTQQLEEMMRANLEKEFADRENVNDSKLASQDLQARENFPYFAKEMFISHSPVISDGRMQPHEWLMNDDGSIIKTDATSHGDDHFFPGPTDIAWDLAGAVIEWKMDHQAANYLLSRYQKLSGDDASHRFPAFLLAYTVFRMGYCKMASEAECGSSEKARLHSAYRRYREKVQELLAVRLHQQRLLR